MSCVLTYYVRSSWLQASMIIRFFTAVDGGFPGVSITSCKAKQQPRAQGESSREILKRGPDGPPLKLQERTRNKDWLSNASKRQRETSLVSREARELATRTSGGRRHRPAAARVLRKSLFRANKRDRSKGSNLMWPLVWSRPARSVSVRPRVPFIVPTASLVRN